MTTQQITADETPWADWTVEVNTGQIVLNVRSTRQGVATLHAMFRNL